MVSIAFRHFFCMRE
uniref:Uncharacterized protein n=1 Tax=Anguilla anguilla TaxID=7936 RepID=A0A0E9VUW3_ANGAN